MNVNLGISILLMLLFIIFSLNVILYINYKNYKINAPSIEKSIFRRKAQLKIIICITLILIALTGENLLNSREYINVQNIITEDGNLQNVFAISDEEEKNKLEEVLLVNKENKLDKDYVPSDLMDMSKFVESTKQELLLQREAGINYIKMVEKMNDLGIQGIVAVSGYRTYEYQEMLFDRKVNEYNKIHDYKESVERAGMIVAPPGASEHQTGLAIDVSCAGIGYLLVETFEDTQVYNWLKDNSYKYGFIIRYEKGKEDITKINYEPWHLRYVGKNVAKEINDRKITLEEYSLLILNQ